MFYSYLGSIHTLELYERIENYSLTSMLLGKLKIRPAANKEKKDISTYYTVHNPKGVNAIELRLVHEGTLFFCCHLHIKINPVKFFMDDDVHYIRPEKINEAMKGIMSSLEEMLGKTVTSHLTIRRVDFTKDIVFQSQECAEQYIKVLKKSLPSKNLEEYKVWDKKQRRKVPYKDSLLLKCKSYDVQIYPKYLQLKSKNNPQAVSARGVVRFELRAKPRKLMVIQKQHPMEDDIVSWITSIVQYSDYIIYEALSLMIGTGDFYSLHEIKKLIDGSTYRSETKTMMKEISTYLSQNKSGMSIIEDLHISKSELREMLNRFNKLGCSPIPVPTRGSTPYFENIIPLDMRKNLLINIRQ